MNRNPHGLLSSEVGEKLKMILVRGDPKTESLHGDVCVGQAVPQDARAERINCSFIYYVLLQSLLLRRTPKENRGEFLGLSWGSRRGREVDLVTEPVLQEKLS